MKSCVCDALLVTLDTAADTCYELSKWIKNSSLDRSSNLRIGYLLRLWYVTPPTQVAMSGMNTTKATATAQESMLRGYEKDGTAESVETMDHVWLTGPVSYLQG